VLEKALRRFPIRAPHDLTDASYWSWHDLRTRNIAKIGARPIVRGVAPANLQQRWDAAQEQQRLARQQRQMLAPRRMARGRR
jgi:hypothetical protein